MNLMLLIEQDGNNVKRRGRTYGGEYAGPCPLCGGDDRFRVWPERDRYWCRKCGVRGDSIQYLRDVRKMGYKEACDLLNISPPGLQDNHPKQEPPGWKPKEVTNPQTQWRKQAARFLAGTQKYLWSSKGERCRQWLCERGIKEQTIRQAGLGYNPRTLYQARESWGLSSEIDERTGRNRRLWIPEGLTIPAFNGGSLARIRIRRPKLNKENKYIIVSGSYMGPMVCNTGARICMVVESELDGLLIKQEAGDIVTVIALGSAYARPDQRTHAFLEKTEIILIALDSDEAGAKEAWKFWCGHYENFIRWPCPFGKDPGDAYQEGMDIRAWVGAGIDHALENQGRGLRGGRTQ